MTQFLAVLALIPAFAHATANGVKIEKPAPSAYCQYAAEGIVIQGIIKQIPKNKFGSTLAEFQNNPSLMLIPERQRNDYNYGYDRVLHEAALDFSFAVVDGDDLEQFIEFGKAMSEVKSQAARAGALEQAIADKTDFARAQKQLRKHLLSAGGLLLLSAVGVQTLLPDAAILVPWLSSGASAMSLGLLYTFFPSTQLYPNNSSSAAALMEKSPLEVWLTAFIDSPQQIPLEPYFKEGNLTVFRKNGPDPQNPKTGAKFLFFLSE